VLSPKDLATRYGHPVNPAINPYTDISIPDDVYVEEQYQDIINIVDYLLPLLEPYEFDNSTAAGRLRGELMWLKQEITNKKFPVPGTRDMVGTLGYLAFNYSLPDALPNLRQPLRAIISLVTCRGLIKPRHYPRIIELIEDTITKGERVLETYKRMSLAEKDNIEGLLSELKKIAHLLFHEKDIFPLNKEDWPYYWDRMTRGDVWDREESFYNSESKLSGAFTSKWRPRQSQPTEGWEMPNWVKAPLDEDDIA